MKTYFKILTAIITLTLLNVSCKRGEAMETTTQTETTFIDNNVANNTLQDTVDPNENSEKNSLKVTSSKGTSKDTKSTTTKTKKKYSNNGWSAPDGTDAENHDGDMYTKHDTTNMPTGTTK